MTQEIKINIVVIDSGKIIKEEKIEKTINEESMQEIANLIIKERDLITSKFCFSFMNNTKYIQQNMLLPLKKFMIGEKQINFLVFQKKAITYQSVTTYSFYDATKKFGKIILKIPKVETLDSEKIEFDFKAKSIEVKVEGEQNYIFAVPKLHYQIDPSQSSYSTKPNELILKVKKIKEGIPFDILHKQKAIGEISDEDQLLYQ